MTFWEWLKLGIENKFCSEGKCDTHEGLYDVMTQWERDEYEEGGDPCIPVWRVWPHGYEMDDEPSE